MKTDSSFKARQGHQRVNRHREHGDLRSLEVTRAKEDLAGDEEEHSEPNPSHSTGTGQLQPGIFRRLHGKISSPEDSLPPQAGNSTGIRRLKNQT